ncbi:hypothetical protein HPB51_016354 [Rhipicephalus microplus]|uniref:Aldehyde dehydrogenase domain-containing protein n=1 Tax=Rhipicephalus microplus TaxID=6941 RepID=A0A9J6ENN7_RHIMP|nr:hypothetical protein HPB51_016354 [Rhipicephalus microplus]
MSASLEDYTATLCQKDLERCEEETRIISEWTHSRFVRATVPVYVDEVVDLPVACRRLMWGKYVNAGQTCIAPDYVLCHTAVYAQFVDTCQKVITEFYSEQPKESADLGRIVNTSHCRLKLSIVSISSSQARDEYCIVFQIFGPVLPILRVNSADEAIEFINQRLATCEVFFSLQTALEVLKEH